MKFNHLTLILVLPLLTGCIKPADVQTGGLLAGGGLAGGYLAKQLSDNDSSMIAGTIGGMLVSASVNKAKDEREARQLGAMYEKGFAQASREVSVSLSDAVEMQNELSPYSAWDGKLRPLATVEVASSSEDYATQVGPSKYSGGNGTPMNYSRTND